MYKFCYLVVIALLTVCLFSPRLHAKAIPAKIDSFKQLIKSSKSDTAKINALIALSDAFDCDDSDNKRYYANEALQLAEKIKWNKGRINADLVLGDIYGSCMKNGISAIKYFQDAVSIARISDDKYLLVVSLNDIGLAYEGLGRHKLAVEYLKEELSVNPDLNWKMGLLGNLGIAYTNIGDYPKALACYDSSLMLLYEVMKTPKGNNQNDTLQWEGLLITIGDVYVWMSDYDKALENYNEALKLNAAAKNKIVECWGYISIGNIYFDKKDFTNAIAYYNKALGDCKEFRSKERETVILSKLGDVYLEKGAAEMALDYTQRSLKLAEENQYIDQMQVCYIALGKIYTKQKKYTEAAVYLQKAISFCESNGALICEKDAWEALSNTYQEMKKTDLAFNAYKQYIFIRDSVFNINKANELTRIDLQTGYSRDSIKHADAYDLKIQKQRVFIYSSSAGFALLLLLSFFIYRNYKLQKNANTNLGKAHELIKKEKQLSENLLLNILPEEVAKELKNHGNVQAKLFDHVTVLFTDFVNFTEAAERDSPQKLVAELHTCFMAFDSIISKYNIEKIKTVGDAYLAVSGLPHANPEHATEIVKAAIEFQNFMIARRKKLGDDIFSMRIGINTGTVVAGIVGVKKFSYDIWGDTVNIAARMEQNSEADKINISQTTYELVKDKFTCEYRGEIDAKGKGALKMYYIS